MTAFADRNVLIPGAVCGIGLLTAQKTIERAVSSSSRT